MKEHKEAAGFHKERAKAVGPNHKDWDKHMDSSIKHEHAAFKMKP
jgi:hypothetical protein